MAFHSSFNDANMKTCCGFAPLPFKTKGKGKNSDEEDDIIDEAIKYYRVNIFFKNYEVQEVCRETIAGASKKLMSLALDIVPRPSEPKFFMNSIFSDPKDIKEAGNKKMYTEALKDETGKRLLDILYTKEGKNILFKFWIGISKRKFLNLTYESI